MIRFKIVFISLASIALLFGYYLPQGKAQCTICKSTVESSMNEGGKTGSGLNDGILYLLATPYLIGVVIGTLWYKKYRRKQIDIQIREKNIFLN